MGDQPGNGKLQPGTEVEIVKLRPDGSHAASYQGTLVTSPENWLVARATWTFRRMHLGYMIFEPGDYLLEYFATHEPFNAFALFSPESEFKGWYCNITHPTVVRDSTIVWHDLYLDVVQRSDRKILVLDEDELEDSDLARQDPDLHRMITSTCETVVSMMRNRDYPFSEV